MCVPVCQVVAEHSKCKHGTCGIWFPVCYRLNKSFSPVLETKSICMIMKEYTTDLAQKLLNLSRGIKGAKHVYYFFTCMFVFIIAEVEKTESIEKGSPIYFMPHESSLPKVVLLDCYALIWKEIWGSQMRFFFSLPIRKKINFMLTENRFLLFCFCYTCWELQWR